MKVMEFNFTRGIEDNIISLIIFLRSVFQKDRTAFINTLWKLWFEPLSPTQPGKGFQHVFIGRYCGQQL